MKRKVALSLAMWLVAGTTMAQTNGIAELSVYNGADREQILIDGAKKEGALTLYTSIAQKDLPPLITAFEKKYGIKVQIWRAGSDKVLQRTLTETAGRRFEVDAVHIGAPELHALHLEKVLQPVRSPAFTALLPGAVPAHREWAASRLTVFVQAYNTNLVKKEELPKSWQDLADSKWKGRLGVEFTDDDWFYSLVQQLGEERGLKLFRDIVAANGLSVRKGHSLLTNLVVSGEVPMALTVYSYMAEALKKRGAPIDWFVLEPAITRANGVAIARRAPHPHAALLFYDYVLSEEAQKILLSMDYIPTNAAVESPLKQMQLKVNNVDIAPNEAEKWTRLYQEIISVTKR